ncbi:MAG: cellulase family glycosylhydrolase [Mariniphaga sp.]|jgi:aryl-phospho-beta-D-glucosidase BglC (GH1 family)|nr:cellulase family glycosylhydrolase [Mariniphaga sp.]
MKNLIAILLLAISPGLAAQTREKAFDINEKLGRGINYGNMFEAPSETAWGNPWKPEYAGIIAELGFNHVRIPIRWEPSDRSMATPPYTIYSSFLNRIKQVVDSALSNGLYAIINMHHHEALYENPDSQKERFIAQWKQISAFFKDYPDSLLFELMNEPHGNLTPEKWNEFYLEVLDSIRTDNPERIVLIGTPEYGGLGGLPYLEIPDDENIILTVHYYNPFQFTHQGASWVGGNADEWLGTEWLDTETEREMMRQDFAPLKAFEIEHNIPVHIGEFGAYSKADIKSRARWTTFLSRYLEELGWSWAYWEFSAGFGVYNPTNKTFYTELVDALLNNEMPDPGRYVGTPVYTSNFQTGNDGWNLNAQQGASAQLTPANNTLNISINNPGTAGWHVQLQRGNISLQAGKKYRYSFKAKAETTRSMTSYIGMSQNPWSAYSGYNGVTLADTFAVYTFIFDANTTDNSARMVFDMGNSDIYITITDIKVEEVTFQPPTGVSGIEKQNLNIYPNPVHNRLYFNGSDEFEKITIFNIRGQMVLKSNFQGMKNSLDVSVLKPGVYLVNFSGKEKSVTRRIVKQ